MVTSDLIRRVLIGALIAPLLTFTALVVFGETDEGDADTPRAAVRGVFSVEGGRIVAPDGSRFVVRGVTVPYGTFAGGRGELADQNFFTATADFKRLKRARVNLVRVLVTPRAGDLDQLSRLWQVVDWARERDLVVQVGAAFTSEAGAAQLMEAVAGRYRRDPYVWYQPQKDPGCRPGFAGARCLDWAGWQQRQMRLIAVVRNAGASAPVVVNTPDYSSTLSGIERHPLGDDNIVWGVHRYPTSGLKFTAANAAAERRAWAGQAREHAVVVDEVGGAGPGDPISPWLPGFLDFVARWEKDEGGSGAIGSVWHWSDGNSMTTEGGELTPWGRLYLGYLAS